MELCLYILAGVCICMLFSLLYHQWRLNRSAYLMREALRNKDFSFRLPTNGLWSGERNMVNVLNNMGQEMKTLFAQNEVESWQKLTRVLTHEIMNATTPINSISQSLLKRPDVKGTPLEEGIKAIRDTGMGLSHFVESYRKFTQLQKPQPSDVNLKGFVSGIVPMYPELNWNISVPDSLFVTVDEGLFRQIFINLIKNAKEAGATKIGISVRNSTENKICISISNNGSPIPASVQSDIFTPFFTTKQTGSGIGLSLSRQMMISQGGNLHLKERPDISWKVTFEIEVISKASS